jgi:hypothetical protein
MSAAAPLPPAARHAHRVSRACGTHVVYASPPRGERSTVAFFVRGQGCGRTRCARGPVRPGRDRGGGNHGLVVHPFAKPGARARGPHAPLAGLGAARRGRSHPGAARGRDPEPQRRRPRRRLLRRHDGGVREDGDPPAQPAPRPPRQPPHAPAALRAGPGAVPRGGPDRARQGRLLQHERRGRDRDGRGQPERRREPHRRRRLHPEGHRDRHRRDHVHRLRRRLLPAGRQRRRPADGDDGPHQRSHRAAHRPARARLRRRPELQRRPSLHARPGQLRERVHDGLSVVHPEHHRAHVRRRARPRRHQRAGRGRRQRRRALPAHEPHRERRAAGGRLAALRADHARRHHHGGGATSSG